MSEADKQKQAAESHKKGLKMQKISKRMEGVRARIRDHEVSLGMRKAVSTKTTTVSKFLAWVAKISEIVRTTPPPFTYTDPAS